MIGKNKSTPNGKAFWEFVEETAERVSHWPKWKGGDGIEPLVCPGCERPLVQHLSPELRRRIEDKIANLAEFENSKALPKTAETVTVTLASLRWLLRESDSLAHPASAEKQGEAK